MHVSASDISSAEAVCEPSISITTTSLCGQGGLCLLAAAHPLFEKNDMKKKIVLKVRCSENACLCSPQALPSHLPSPASYNLNSIQFNFLNLAIFLILGKMIDDFFQFK